MADEDAQSAIPPEEMPLREPVAAAVGDAREREGSLSVGLIRLIIGAIQGAALYGLYSAADAHVWPATSPSLFVPLSLIAFFVPLILLQGLTTIRATALIVWAIAAALILAGLGYYDVWREWPAETAVATQGLSDANLPSFALFFFASTAIFISHALIAEGAAARKLTAPYALYFESAWKLGVQFALSVLFTGIFWLVLWLGASLFQLIDIDVLNRIIDKAWFAIPATALALSIAVHVSDMRGSMVATVRSLVLALLSWLLPLVAGFAAAFLVALIFTGFEPLWKTRTAAALLLTAAGALVIFINAAFQDGTRLLPRVLRISSIVAGFALLPLVLIAGYAIALRVSQYGWTAERVAAAAVAIVALCYAVGYFTAAIAGVRGQRGAGSIEATNVAASFLVVAVILALLSPVADPMRIAVDSQVAALETGKVAPDKFDFIHLRWHGGRFGQEALARLALVKDTKIAKRAADALKGIYQWNKPPPPTDIAHQVTIYPSDFKLPDSLLDQKWDASRTSNLPPCLISSVICEAFVIDLNGDGRDEYLFVWGDSDDSWDATIMAQETNGPWYPAATLPWPHCKAAREALRKGQYSVVAPTSPKWRGIDAGETNFQPVPVIPVKGCP